MALEDSIVPSPTLEETFYILSKKNAVYRVKLSEKGLCMIKEVNGNVKTETIALEDIIGCRCMRSKRFDHKCIWHPTSRKNNLKVVDENSSDWDERDVSAYLYIYAYVLKKGKVKSKKRERIVITLRFRSYDQYEDNMKEAQKWKVSIKHYMSAAHQNAPRCFLGSDHSTVIGNKILFVVNPKSGVGKARELFQNKVVPILSEADVNYDLHVTRHPHDAQNVVRSQNMWQYMGGIVAVGGDGILYEIINGLMERPDWDKLFTELKLGIIPCGSGNGLAKSVSYAFNEPYDQSPVLVSALNVVHGMATPLDLVRVETEKQVLFSFLSIGWGLISDIDIESERIRAFGSQRFVMWTLGKLVSLRSYKGTVSYLPIDNSSSSRRIRADSDGDMHSVSEGGGRRDSFYSISSRKSTYMSAAGSSYESLTDDSVKTFGPPSLIPPLDQPLPSYWTVVKGNFIMVHASYPSHLMTDCIFAPNAKLDDGCIWLCIIKSGISRTHLAQFLLGMSSGSHVGVSDIDFLPVAAFRIEPESSGSHLTVDGELIEHSALQAEILPSMANVFARVQ